MNQPLTLVFLGSGHYAPVVLRSIIKEPLLKTLLVVTGDQNEGSPASLSAQVARENDLPLYSWTTDAQDAGVIEKIKNLQPDFLLVADFGHKKHPLPKEILSLPHYGAVNIHPSLLPRYRGTTPVQSAIINGDREVGVSLILMDDKFDHGPLLAQAHLPLAPTATAPELYSALFILGAKILPRVLRLAHNGLLLRGRLGGTTRLGAASLLPSPRRPRKGEPDSFFQLFYPPQEQNHTQAIYTKMLKKEDGKINWQKSPTEIERMVRAYQPWPGVWTTLGELLHRYIVTLLERIPNNNLAKQQNNNKHPTIKQLTPEKRSKRIKITKASLNEENKLVIEQLQIEGKKPISWEEFARGYL